MSPLPNPGLALAALAWFVLPVSGAAQSAGDRDSEPPETPDYVLADLPSNALMYSGDRFWFKPLIAVVADYTFFEQNDASIDQVGRQEDSQDLRAARIGFNWRQNRERSWEFLFAMDYQESRTRTDTTFRLYDLRLRLPVGAVNIDIGKQKQPFALEVGSLSILYPQMERIMAPFFVTRSIGIKASGMMAGDRMTWAAGWFNDWLESNASFRENADDYVARITGLASVSADSRDFLHFGLGFRRAGPDIGTLQMSGKPESNVADRYVDTGEFPASFAAVAGMDMLWSRGPFLLAAEHMWARASSEESGDPHFTGSYLLLSWMLTGESRPYLRKQGTIGPVIPNSRRGAFELVARYSHLDLDDAAINGGILDKWHFGGNWWITPQWKAGLAYGDAQLDRDGIDGNTRMLLFRMQWFY